MRRRRVKHEYAVKRGGMLLLCALVCLSLVMALFVAALRSLALEREQIRASEFRLQAEYLAEAGLGRALAQLAADEKYVGETWQPDLASGGRAAKVTIEIRSSSNALDSRMIRVKSEYPIDHPLSATRVRTHEIALSKREEKS